MLFRTLTFVTAALAFAQGATAQSADELLNSLIIGRRCIQGVSNLLGTEFATCASLGSLFPVVTASGSLVEPINTYLGSVCRQPNCSAATVANATAILEAGCSDELDAGNVAVVALRDIVANFPSVKEGICLQQSTNGSYCATAVLTNFQNALGTDLTLSKLANVNLSALEDLPAQRMCDNCLHAMTTKLLPVFESDPAESQVGRAMAQYCGTTFLDGQIPSTVQEWSGNATSSAPPVTSAPISGAIKAMSYHYNVGVILAFLVGLGILY